MDRPFLSKLAAGVALLLGMTATSPGIPRVYPTGVTIYDPQRAFNSMICFTGPDGLTHLIDMNGHEVHRWAYAGQPGSMIDPVLVGGQRGHILLQTGDIADSRGGIFTNRTVAEIDWDGNIVWQWGAEAPGGAARQNHDWQRLPNGKTLLLVTVPRAVPGLGPKQIGDQAIYEIAPDGRIVWTWIAGDHLRDFGFGAAGMRYLRERVRRNSPEPYGYLEINDMQILGPNRWFDAGDTRFNPQNILIDTRKGNAVLILSRKTGRVVWRLGPNFPGSEFSPDQRIVNRVVPRAVDQISGQHDAQLIPRGLPGAGNLLLFDDQGGAGFPPAALGIYAGSRVLEIDPIRKQVVWQYTGANSGRPVWTFFSSFVSSAQRLPNGNTLIDEGMDGRLFQITPAGDIVWEYIVPFVGRSTVAGKPFVNSLTYRAQAVPYNWVPDSTTRSEDPVLEPKTF